MIKAIIAIKDSKLLLNISNLMIITIFIATTNQAIKKVYT